MFPQSGQAPTPYPEGRAARNRWILARRGPKISLDPWQPYGYFWEEETGADGQPIPTATVLLTNRECPYRCLMCDLWRNTLDSQVPPDAIAAQIRHALSGMPPDRPFPRQIKLYNAGSFFDPKAIPPEDYREIARSLRGFERVIVECHPALIREPVLAFRAMLAAEGVDRFQIAIGLETVHSGVLEKLNKGITVESFCRAADFLRSNGIELRVFILVRPPFLSESEGVEWGCRSLDTAFDCGAAICCIIPTRGGNGAMEALRDSGDFSPPSLKSLEAVHEYGLGLRRGRVFADLWDIEKFYCCECSARRATRLAEINASQRVSLPIHCEMCDESIRAGEVIRA